MVIETRVYAGEEVSKYRRSTEKEVQVRVLQWRRRRGRWKRRMWRWRKRRRCWWRRRRWGCYLCDR